MGLDKTKPLKDESALAGEISSERGCDSDVLPKRIERYEKAKRRTNLNIQYLGSSVDFCSDEVSWLKRRLESCSNWLVFRDYFTVGVVKLERASFCMKHLMCQMCAIRRAVKSLTAYLERFEVITAQNPRLVPYLLTLTVVNGEDLQERFEHLVKSWKEYQKRRRQFISCGRGFNELCKVEGAVFSYEFTHSEKGGWHPHLHAIVMVEPSDLIEFDFTASGYKKSESRLSKEWLSITGDSSIVDCRPIDTEDTAKSFSEVFKYALKFSELEPKENYIAHKVLNNKRLLGSFGLFRGVVISKDLTDELLEGELPYLELFYRYTSDKGFSVIDTHLHKGGPELRQESKTREGCSLEERGAKAFAKMDKYRSNWEVVERATEEGGGTKSE